MKIKLLFLLSATVLLSNCKKNTTDADNFTSNISATIDGRNYSSNNVEVIRAPYSNDLFSFYSMTSDSLAIGIQLNPTSPSYEPGNYTFRQAGSQDVILISFTIIDTNSTALLKWTTSKEINLSYFEIERSADGTNFLHLGQVSANGDTTGIINYTFTDANNTLVQNYYYRLKTISLDGSFHFSTTIKYSGWLKYFAYYGEKSIKYKGFNGDIHITSNDRTKRIVTGSFFFDFVNSSGQKKQIRNGKFKVLY